MPRKIYSVPAGERVEHVAGLIGSTGYEASKTQPKVAVLVHYGRFENVASTFRGRVVGCARSTSSTSPAVLILNTATHGLMSISLATVASITPIEETP
jgi:hypothetical protein